MAREVVDSAFAVRRELGAGLLESFYCEALEMELVDRGIHVAREVPVVVEYKQRRLRNSFRVDFVAGHKVLVEAKAAKDLHPVFEAQTLTYLRLTGCPIGLLINFSQPRLADGIRRFVMSNA